MLLTLIPPQQLNPKRKVFETVSAELTTTESLEVVYKGVPLMVAGNKLTVASIPNAQIR